jgi:hypothetical protein
MSKVRDAEDTEWRWFDLQTERRIEKKGLPPSNWIHASNLDQYKRVTFIDREKS